MNEKVESSPIDELDNFCYVCKKKLNKKYAIDEKARYKDKNNCWALLLNKDMPKRDEEGNLLKGESFKQHWICGYCNQFEIAARMFGVEKLFSTLDIFGYEHKLNKSWDQYTQVARKNVKKYMEELAYQVWTAKRKENK